MFGGGQLFAVIIPFYNNEPYLADAIESVIHQSVGFKKNIHIILVNDGSTDGGEKVALSYVKKYPQNITYIYQENQGVSAARNAGFAQVTASFVRRNMADGLLFEPTVKYGEDMQYLTRLLFRTNGKIGFVRDPVFYYRRRKNQSSAVQGQVATADYWTITQQMHAGLMELSQKTYGTVIPYMQWMTCYENQWRLRHKIASNLFEQLGAQAEELAHKNIQNISDYIICQQKNNAQEDKIQMLCFKYGKNIVPLLEYRRHKLYFKGEYVYDLGHKSQIRLETINFLAGTVELRGFINCPVPESSLTWYAVLDEGTVQEKVIPLLLKDTKIGEKSCFNKPYRYYRGFVLRVPVGFRTLSFKNIYQKLYQTKTDFLCCTNSKLDNTIKLYFIDKTNKKIFWYNSRKIKCRPLTIKNRLFFYARLTQQLLKKKCIKELLFRTAASFYKKTHRRELWLFTDRPRAANDNGFALFKYILTVHDKKIRPIFAVEKTCPDYKKVHALIKSKDGRKSRAKLVPFGSFGYKVRLMAAKKIVSSQADMWVYNPFGSHSTHYRDFFTAHFCFLQHGIIKDDISVWLNQYEKNLSLFVTASPLEQKSIIQNPAYGYDERIVRLTGMPRYDLLEDTSGGCGNAASVGEQAPQLADALAVGERKPQLANPAALGEHAPQLANPAALGEHTPQLANRAPLTEQHPRLIAVMPTWRKELSREIDWRTGTRPYSADFAKSAYFDFYNRLINDERLLSAMRAHNIKGVFAVHPSHAEQWRDFTSNDVFTVTAGIADYNHIFCSASLVVNDYSSSSFDFSYMNKPVIYAQFDKAQFFHTHTYIEGYFNYECDGFGPVLYDYESTVQEILRQIECGFVLEEKYKERIKGFYAYHDKQNSARVYKAIKECE